MFDQPTITPSSDKEWKDYYHRKYNEADKQLQDLAWMFAHMMRFVFEEKKRDAYMLGQRAARRLQYPRDKEAILAELGKNAEFAGSILRDEEGEAK